MKRAKFCAIFLTLFIFPQYSISQTGFIVQYSCAYIQTKIALSSYQFIENLSVRANLHTYEINLCINIFRTGSAATMLAYKSLRVTLTFSNIMRLDLGWVSSGFIFAVWLLTQYN